MHNIYEKAGTLIPNSARISIAAIAILLCAVVIRKFDNQYMVTVAAIMLGVSLFYVRETQRIYYGAIEIIFAFVVIFDAASKGRSIFEIEDVFAMPDVFDAFQPRVVLLQLGAAIYVLIRGLDNLKQGWEKRDGGKVSP